MRKAYTLCAALCLSSLMLQAQQSDGHFTMFDAPGVTSAPETNMYPLHELPWSV